MNQRQLQRNDPSIQSSGGPIHAAGATRRLRRHWRRFFGQRIKKGDQAIVIPRRPISNRRQPSAPLCRHHVILAHTLPLAPEGSHAGDSGVSDGIDQRTPPSSLSAFATVQTASHKPNSHRDKATSGGTALLRAVIGLLALSSYPEVKQKVVVPSVAETTQFS